MSRILVVDDEPEVRAVIKQALVEQGYEVWEAASGAEAYQMTAGVPRAKQPDLVILDLMLPQIHGFEVLRKLKENPATADVPMVIVTARDDAQDEMRAMRAGAADYITKPWPPGELESSVKMALDYARASQPNLSPVRQSGQ